MSAAVGDVCRDELRMLVEHVRGNLSSVRQQHVIQRVLNKLLNQRESFLEAAKIMSLGLCERLVDLGHLGLSHFGTYDPVDVAFGKSVAPLMTSRYPLVYRDVLYYFRNEDNRAAFQTRPSHYLASRAPPLAEPLHVVVTGPPLSGKTRLAARLADIYAVPLWDMPTLVSMLEEHAFSGDVIVSLCVVVASLIVCLFGGRSLPAGPGTASSPKRDIVRRSAGGVCVRCITIWARMCTWDGAGPPTGVKTICMSLQ